MLALLSLYQLQRQTFGDLERTVLQSSIVNQKISEVTAQLKLGKKITLGDFDQLTGWCDIDGLQSDGTVLASTSMGLNCQPDRIDWETNLAALKSQNAALESRGIQITILRVLLAKPVAAPAITFDNPQMALPSMKARTLTVIVAEKTPQGTWQTKSESFYVSQ